MEQESNLDFMSEHQQSSWLSQTHKIWMLC